jgi:hypothetical protein
MQLANCVLVLRIARLRVPYVDRALEHLAVALSVAVYASVLAQYAVSPGFRDHVEPSVGSIASALLQGQPPYHGTTGSASYELPYGPGLFFVEAAALALFGRSLPSLKVFGLLACGGALILVFDILRRRASLRCAAGGLLLFIAYLLYYDARAYWCRPEPFLLLGSALALWLVRARPKSGVPAYVFLIAGMLNFKATGILYIAPSLVLLAAARGRRRALLAASGGVLTSLVLFALPPLSLAAYLDVLGKTARHGLSGREFLLNGSAAMVLILPALIVRAFRMRGPVLPPQRGSWLVPVPALVSCMFVVCIVAAKPGAGRHHLLPFLPACIEAFVDGVDGIERGRIGLRAARFLTLTVRAALASVVSGFAAQSIGDTWRDALHEREIARELSSLLSEYRGYQIQMGYGDWSSYGDTDQRVLVSFQQPLLLDGASQMDSTAAGRSAYQMFGASLDACRPRVWIIPSGEPFSMQSFYRPGSGAIHGDGAVFDAAFRAEFTRLYEPIESRTYFRVYRCRAA